MEIAKAFVFRPSSSSGGRNEGEATQNTKKNPQKWQYVTVRQGDYDYTYVVIGENFKVLIGRVPVDKDEEKEKDEKEKNQLKAEAANKKQAETLLANNQAALDYQQFRIMALSKSNFQKKIQSLEESSEHSYSDCNNLDAKK